MKLQVANLTLNISHSNRFQFVKNAHLLVFILVVVAEFCNASRFNYRITS